MIRLIELFSGIGAQAAALKRLNIEFEQWITSEWEVNAVASYKAIHTNDDTDYSKDIPDNELNYILFNLGVSTDGKKQLTLDQIKRKGESWKRTVYNNFKATNNIGSIVNAKADDLKIQDTGKFTYLLTYSFPCQDLSVAGKGKGMKKGSGTRSGMLWEVERLLNECKELPQILLMENVPQVHGKKNIDDFNQWINFLENKGYHNFWKDLNSKDFGVAQNRNRTFMVSLLNRKSYSFPTPIPLTKKMKDYLEDEVDEKYYLKGEKVQKLLDNLIMSGKISTDRQTDRQTVDGTINNTRTIERANCIKARYDAGISNQRAEGNMVCERTRFK